MSVLVELYTPKPGTGSALPTDHREPDDADYEAYLLELDAQRHALGLLTRWVPLTALAQRIAAARQRVTLRRASPFPLLTGTTWAIWQQYLPTAYVEPVPAASAGSPTLRGLKDYAFDLPPVTVLDCWADLAQRKVFDAWEIRTPERLPVDPILLGYTEGVGPFLIARWGESLRPFEEIAAAARDMASASYALQLQQLQQLTRRPEAPLPQHIPARVRGFGIR